MPSSFRGTRPNPFPQVRPIIVFRTLLLTRQTVQSVRGKYPAFPQKQGIVPKSWKSGGKVHGQGNARPPRVAAIPQQRTPNQRYYKLSTDNLKSSVIREIRSPSGRRHSSITRSMVPTSGAVRMPSLSPLTWPMDLPYQLIRLRMQCKTCSTAWYRLSSSTCRAMQFNFS